MGKLLVTGFSERSDEELMALLKENELEALEALYDRHHRLALALAFRVLGDRELAEDVIQESFLSVWRQAQTYERERGRAREWLLSIVRHRAIDRVRRNPKPSSMAELDESLVDQRATAVWEQVDQNLQRERVLQVLDTLPSEQRDAVDLAYYGGFTHQEISERTGAPLGTVKGRMRLAMQKLAVALADLASEPKRSG